MSHLPAREMSPEETEWIRWTPRGGSSRVRIGTRSGRKGCVEAIPRNPRRKLGRESPADSKERKGDSQSQVHRGLEHCSHSNRGRDLWIR